MALSLGGNLFGRSDVRENPDITKGVPININTTITGGGGAQQTAYTVPVGRKFVCYLLYSTIQDDCTADLIGRNSDDDQLFAIAHDFTANTNFLDGTTAVFEAGANFLHDYNGGVAGNSQYSIIGVEIDDD